GTDFVKYANVLALVEAQFGGETAVDRFKSAEEKAIRAAGFNRTQWNRFVHKVEQPLHEAGYADPDVPALVTFLDALFEGPVRERIFSRVLTRAQIDAELESIIQEALSPNGLDERDRNALANYVRTFFNSRYEHYLPEKAVPITAASLSEHQINLVRTYARLL